MGFVEELKSYIEEVFLVFYIWEWNCYINVVKYIYYIFGYLNCYWVKWEMDEGKKLVYDVYILYFVKWCDVFFY